MSNSRSWPFEQARALLERVGPEPRLVTFETGYGPSGAPHIGTFAEVVRTQMVRHAFEHLTEGRYPTSLIVFSDDYDAMRRVPDGLPNEMNEDLGLPLSEVRDPVVEGNELFRSFAERNNAALVDFIHAAGIRNFTFRSASRLYKSGDFNDALLNVLRNYDGIMNVMLPTLGEERRATYSAFLPRDLATGRVLQIPMVEHDVENGDVVFRDGDRHITTQVFDGHVKLQWKVDWAMRWGVLGVDYEMSGKDLIDSVKASSKIARVLGHEPPLNMTYELFLDENGEKISKSRGNGLSVEEWLTYSTREALAQFMFQNPRAAKKLYRKIIPQVTDEYLKNLVAYQDQTEEARLDNPVWHIHAGNVPVYTSDVSYALLVNLASVSNATDPEVLRQYLATYRNISEEDRPIIEELLPKVIAYVQEEVLPSKVVRDPTPDERVALLALTDVLSEMEDGLDGEAYQFHVYEIGKAHYAKENLRQWFRAIYEVIFGAESGPRFGTFIAAYGRQASIDLILGRTHD